MLVPQSPWQTVKPASWPDFATSTATYPWRLWAGSMAGGGRDVHGGGADIPAGVPDPREANS